jgi:caffeoyl-CoA O-methyltransferase
MIVDAAIEAYAAKRTKPEPEILTRLTAETYRTMSSPGMLTGRLEGRLLKILVTLSGARRVLEIGTFTGYSALSMAEALPEDGTLITCDVNPRHTALAQRYFDESPHGKKISIRLAPALETLAVLDGPFDLVFIDADKGNYERYYEAVIDKVRIGGLVVVDNTLWSGKVLDAQPDEETRTIDALNRRIADDPRVENVLLTVRDGVQVVVRRR